MPNDFMQNFDPISILIFTPLLDRLIYPALRRRGIELRPIARISIGFMLAAICLGKSHLPTIQDASLTPIQPTQP